MTSSLPRRVAARAQRALARPLAVLGASQSPPARAAAPPRALPQLLRRAGAAPQGSFRVSLWTGAGGATDRVGVR